LRPSGDLSNCIECRGLTGDQRSALVMLAGCPDGCSEAIMIGRGFPLDLLAGLIGAGLAVGVRVFSRRGLLGGAWARLCRGWRPRVDGGSRLSDNQATPKRMFGKVTAPPPRGAFLCMASIAS
jgi:hypothetical protein